MKMKIRITFFLLLIYIISFTQEKDFVSWTAIEINKKMNKKISLALEEQLRMFNNVSYIKTVFTQISTGFKFNKYFKAEASYRFIQEPDLNFNYFLKHRYDINLYYKNKINDICFTLRTRFQQSFEDLYKEYANINPEIYIRNKLTLNFDLDKKYIPYIGTELYYSLNNVELSEGKSFKKYRLFLGTNYKINKKQEIKLFYIFQNEINVSNPLNSNIIGIKYSYRLS